MIDTNLAAENAAKMLVGRANAGEASAAAPKGESSAFKQLKEQIAKPQNLERPKPSSWRRHAAEKSGSHFNMHQQKGHNQTFGGGTKSGVPRRTNG